MKTKAHFTAPELLSPTNPIEVCLIGAGGTGSQMLTALARMSHSLQALGHTGFQVSLWDGDIVTDANRGRQLFAECEVGLLKAVALITRCNRFFGTGWKAVERKFDSQSSNAKAAIYISCVDTVAARFDIAQAISGTNSSQYNNTTRYWMDFGNGKDTGQVVLSTIGKVRQPKSDKFETVDSLPLVTEEFGELLQQSETDSDTPSCSLAEALEKQDLFINSALAQMGCSLLWQLFRSGMIMQRGFFMNIADFRTAPLPV